MELRAQSTGGWKTYRCNFFEVGIPPNFVPKPERGGEDRGDGVSLWNDRLQVEFYVYSPQWNGVASRTATGPAETLGSH